MLKSYLVCKLCVTCSCFLYKSTQCNKKQVQISTSCTRTQDSAPYVKLMTILKPICLIFLYERPPCLSGMCSNDDDDDAQEPVAIGYKFGHSLNKTFTCYNRWCLVVFWVSEVEDLTHPVSFYLDSYVTSLMESPPMVLLHISNL